MIEIVMDAVEQVWEERGVLRPHVEAKNPTASIIVSRRASAIPKDSSKKLYAPLKPLKEVCKKVTAGLNAEATYFQSPGTMVGAADSERGTADRRSLHLK